MKNYKNNNGCWNCKLVFLYSRQDELDYWYCNIDNNRPPCGNHCNKNSGYKESHLYNLDGCYLPENEIIKRNDNWYKWTENRNVAPYGICDMWMEK